MQTETKYITVKDIRKAIENLPDNAKVIVRAGMVIQPATRIVTEYKPDKLLFLY